MVPWILYVGFCFVLQTYCYHFVNPANAFEVSSPPDPSGLDVYTIGEILEIKWAASTNGEGKIAPQFHLIQLNAEENVPEGNVSIDGPTVDTWTYNWTIDIADLSLEYSHEFYLYSNWVTTWADWEPWTTRFNLTEPPTTTSTTAPTSILASHTTTLVTIPSTSQTSPMTTSTTTNPTSTSTVSSQPTSSGGLSVGAKAGIGVAIPIATIAAFAAGILFAQRKRKNITTEMIQNQPTQGSLAHQSQPSYADTPLSEMPDTSPKSPPAPVELPGISK